MSKSVTYKVYYVPKPVAALRAAITQAEKDISKWDREMKDHILVYQKVQKEIERNQEAYRNDEYNAPAYYRWKALQFVVDNANLASRSFNDGYRRPRVRSQSMNQT